MWKIAAGLLLAASMFATGAHAQSRLRPVGADIRFALEQSARESKAPMERRLSERSGALGNATMALTCDANSAVYWDDVARWIAQNTRDVRPQGSLASFNLATNTNNLRGMVVRAERAIAAVPRHEFLRTGETVVTTPVDHAANLRQRAEWTTYLSSLFIGMGTAQAEDPQDFGKTYGLALWTRAYCRLTQKNLEAARAAFSDLGYPDAARFGPETENAFILLTRAGGDSAFATEALAAAGDGASPAARRVLGAMAQPPAPQ